MVEAKASKVAELESLKEKSEESKKIRAEARLKYLLAQSDTFTRFLGVSGGVALPGPREEEASAPKKSKKRKADGEIGGEGGGARKRKSEREEDKTLLEDSLSERVVRLTSQPSIIKFGQLRDYQMEVCESSVRLCVHFGRLTMCTLAGMCRG